MQIYFHRQLFSHLSRVPILVEGTVIICNCIYSVVINCGWNNNVAVKIVTC